MWGTTLSVQIEGAQVSESNGAGAVHNMGYKGRNKSHHHTRRRTVRMDRNAAGFTYLMVSAIKTLTPNQYQYLIQMIAEELSRARQARDRAIAAAREREKERNKGKPKPQGFNSNRGNDSRGRGGRGGGRGPRGGRRGGGTRNGTW